MPQPPDPDVEALLHLAVMWNVPLTSDRATVASYPLVSRDLT